MATMTESPEASRRPKANTARLERKRATDRDSQRAVRAKTKSYIEHLESTIRQLEQCLKTNDTGSLAAKITEQHAEIQRLRATIRNATRMLDGSVAQLMNGTEDAKGPNGTDPGNPVVLTTPAPELLPAPQPPPPQILPPTVPLTQSPDIAYESSAIIPPPCGEGTSNYFGILSTKLASIQNDIAFVPMTSPEEDEDLSIRAVLHGWHAAEQRHVLDPVWKLLQATDQGLFYRSGPVERIAVLRLMRPLLLFKLNPFWHPTPKFPAYMAPGPAQQTAPHAAVSDFFAWPALREFLVMSNTTYIPEFAAAQFAVNLRFRWPYELSDVYMTQRASGRYFLSDVFNAAMEDLSSWTLDKHVKGIAPEFHGLIPISHEPDQHYIATPVKTEAVAPDPLTRWKTI